VGREREAPATVAAVAEVDGQHEQNRDEGGRAEAQVGALLEAELEQLPAVDGGDARPRTHPGGGAADRWNPRGLDRAHRAATAGGSAFTAPSPSVSEKNKSSSVTVCGASIRISAPASISAWESSATAASSAVKTIRPWLIRTSSSPGWARHTASARSSSVVDSR